MTTPTPTPQILFMNISGSVIVDQPICCQRCRSMHYLLKNAQGRTLCLNCAGETHEAGPVLDAVTKEQGPSGGVNT